MCYSIYLSTTSQEDLSLLASDQFSFSQVADSDDPDMLDLLDHPQKWYLECKYGCCSCHFRHMGFIWSENGAYFSAPEDWSPEEAEDVISTMAVYDVFQNLVNDGGSLDLVDYWVGAEAGDIKPLIVSFSKVPRDQFRFFGGVKFTFVA